MMEQEIVQASELLEEKNELNEILKMAERNGDAHFVFRESWDAHCNGVAIPDEELNMRLLQVIMDRFEEIDDQLQYL